MEFMTKLFGSKDVEPEKVEPQEVVVQDVQNVQDVSWALSPLNHESPNFDPVAHAVEQAIQAKVWLQDSRNPDSPNHIPT